MPSNINAALPPAANPTTAGVRANMQAAKTEIEEMQLLVLPALGGVAHFNTTKNQIIAPGVIVPITKYSVVQLILTANTTALAIDGIIPFSAVSIDDIGLTTLNFASQPGRAYFPKTTKRLRVGYRVSYAYDAPTPVGTYRGVAPNLYLDSALSSITGLTGPKIVAPINYPATPVVEAIITDTTGIIDIVGLAPITDNNWIQIALKYNGATSRIIKGDTTSFAAHLTLECWE